ncbi:hypothetical protein CKAH01_10801 [Colletotrichum kahawae]|uniref:Uncharacterized protein n=1 Tax=Colletotrichum kahawae TaxID=34407 RepID=A0AAE0CX12_COLKA|nr:hypothetical protein CKAH01_10801 [Colletotrichum kahawae]
MQKTMAHCDEGDVDVTDSDGARKLKEYQTEASPGALGEGGVVSGLYARHTNVWNHVTKSTVCISSLEEARVAQSRPRLLLLGRVSCSGSFRTSA